MQLSLTLNSEEVTLGIRSSPYILFYVTHMFFFQVEIKKNNCCQKDCFGPCITYRTAPNQLKIPLNKLPWFGTVFENFQCIFLPIWFCLDLHNFKRCVNIRRYSHFNYEGRYSIRQPAIRSTNLTIWIFPPFATYFAD